MHSGFLRIFFPFCRCDNILLLLFDTQTIPSKGKKLTEQTHVLETEKLNNTPFPPSETCHFWQMLEEEKKTIWPKKDKYKKSKPTKNKGKFNAKLWAYCASFESVQNAKKPTINNIYANWRIIYSEKQEEEG